MQSMGSGDEGFMTHMMKYLLAISHHGLRNGVPSSSPFVHCNSKERGKWGRFKM